MSFEGKSQEETAISGKRLHDLNQPLNAIKMISGGILYLLGQGKSLPDDELAECMKKIVAQTDRLAGMLAGREK